ncbi:MAG TPA: tetratricopeptide repeat protein, partial [Terriglobia bacterium]|nr:tetratricopeptide repeat protein [Terriglobia bacterium]
LFERVLEIDQAAWGPKHPEVAADLNQLGRALEAEGDYAKAEAHYLRALEIRETTPGTKPEQIAKCLDKLAAVCRTEGRQDEANAFAQRAAAIRTGASGATLPAQPKTRQAAREIEPAKREKQIPEPALQAPARAEGPASGKPGVVQPTLPAQEKVSSRSPEVAAVPDSAAQRPAEFSMKRMILLPASQAGLNRPEAAQNLSELAERYTRERRFAEAEKLYEGALDIERSVSGARDAGGGATLNNLGCVHFAEGHLEKAARLFQESLSVWLKCLGPEHPFIAAPLNNLAAVSMERRASLEAEALYKRSLKISETPSDVRDTQLPVILANLTELYGAQGRHQEAAALVEKLKRS